VLLSVFLAKNVLSQPASPRPQGLLLLLDLGWSGVVYGVADALVLSVIPVLATWAAFSHLGWTASWPGKIAVGDAALLTSLLVTTLYHYGFSEYHGAQMKAPLVGNGIMSLGYLLTANPLTALISHAVMHVTAVLHGAATTLQLPPLLIRPN
jgi:hypothetical protein